MNSLLAITYAFILSCCPFYSTGMEGIKEEHIDSTRAYFQIGIELFDSLDLYAGEDTYQVQNGDITNWKPFTQSYWLGVEYHKTFCDELGIKAGLRHKCRHPVTIWEEQTSSLNSAVTELYIGIEGKVSIF